MLSTPLAARMRPKQLADFVGQTHLLGSGKPLYEMSEAGHLYSMILWGPPGTGKTTLAHLMALNTHAVFCTISAVLAGVKEIRDAIAQANILRKTEQVTTVLFIDEVHRFNKAQQDAFLPAIEEGIITFIGATTENPGFALNNALLSRVRTYVLNALTTEDILAILKRALWDKENGLGGRSLQISDEDLTCIARSVNGDARNGLNVLEMAADLAQDTPEGAVISHDDIVTILGDRIHRFDKKGDIFYEQISALHKSVRGSAPDAALYWLVCMLSGGCDPLYIARRIVRMASEDIGNADPRALQLALNAWDVQQRLGMPEGELALAQSVIYLACAPKSNAVYMALHAAKEDIQKTGQADVPIHLRNAPRQLMRELGYGRDYRYAHDEPNAYAAGEQYFPDNLTPCQYYRPVPRGLEIKIKEKLAYLADCDRRAKYEK